MVSTSKAECTDEVGTFKMQTLGTVAVTGVASGVGDGLALAMAQILGHLGLERALHQHLPASFTSSGSGFTPLLRFATVIVAPVACSLLPNDRLHDTIYTLRCHP